MNFEVGLLEINIIGHCILLSETLIYLDLNFIWRGSSIFFKLYLENFASSRLGTYTQLYQLEPSRPSAKNLPTTPSFYKTQKYFGGFYFY